MANLIDLIVDSNPQNGAVAVPLRTKPYITLSGPPTDYDQSTLSGMFLEGPDSDQFIGPGGAYLRFPDGISQGNLDDLLESPGYQGITAGTVTVSGVNGNTRVIFEPDLPLAALTEYKLFLDNVEDVNGVAIDGAVLVNFQTGTGSIMAIPSDSSTSVLATTAQASRAIDAIAPLTVLRSTPADHAIQQDISLDEIEVEFSKSLDPASVSADSVRVETFPISDHPKLSTTALGELATAVEVDGNKLKIKI